jgi:hypothetical protein
MTEPKQSSIAVTIWQLLILSTLLASAYLCAVCLFSGFGVFAQASKSQYGTNKPPSLVSTATETSSQPSDVPGPAQTKLIELDARTNEMSKRIEETGNHATRVLSLIGLLVGFISGIVAIGLWQSKQYIDRVVEHYKTEMKSFIKEETEKRLSEISVAMVSQFDETLTKTIEELSMTGATALKDLEKHGSEASASIDSLAEDRMESHLRLGVLLIDRLPNIYHKALDDAVEKGILTAEEKVIAKEEVEFAVYAQKEILQGLVQLESSHVSEVIAGCHKLSAIQDRTCLPALKSALSRWSQRGDQRAVEQISAAYEKLMGTHNEE